MNFLDEFAEKLGFERKLISSGFKIFCFSFDNILIEGHKGILIFSAEEMRFRIKGGTVGIVGGDLSLKNFNKHSAIVMGNIAGVELNKRETQN